MSRGNRALVYSDGTIIIIRAMLEETMPMLISSSAKNSKLTGKVITMLVLNTIFESVRESMTLT